MLTMFHIIDTLLLGNELDQGQPVDKFEKHFVRCVPRDCVPAELYVAFWYHPTTSHSCPRREAAVLFRRIVPLMWKEMSNPKTKLSPGMKNEWMGMMVRPVFSTNLLFFPYLTNMHAGHRLI